MTSQAFTTWDSTSKDKLDEFEKAHRAVTPGQSGRGRRWATEQVNHSYVVAVAAQFQKFCRDLHSEASLLLADQVPNPVLKNAVRALFLDNRKLDSGNAHDGTIGPDFKRLGLDFIEEVDLLYTHNKGRRRRLQQLNVWRNAIVHQNFNLKQADQALTLGTTPNLRWVRVWRGNCTLLAEPSTS